MASKSVIPALVTLAVSCAHGALVLQTQIDSGSPPSVLQPLAGDLLETSVASFSGENAEALVRNGAIVGAFGADTAGSFPAKVWGQAVTTYDFDLTTNTLGYDITMIQAYSAWADRASQSYQIFYAQVGSPSTFLQLGGDIIATNAGGSIITRSEDSVLGTAILNNVSSIRFVQIDGSVQLDGIETVFRELDVVGFAAIPEPTTSVLGLGAPSSYSTDAALSVSDKQVMALVSKRIPPLPCRNNLAWLDCSRDRLVMATELLATIPPPKVERLKLARWIPERNAA